MPNREVLHRIYCHRLACGGAAWDTRFVASSAVHANPCHPFTSEHDYVRSQEFKSILLSDKNMKRNSVMCCPK